MNKISNFLRFVVTITTLLLSACGSARATSTPDVGGGKAEPIPVAFIGMVESIAGDQWVVNGQTVTVAADAIHDGPFSVGDQVKVEGVVNADGSFRVSRVEVPTPQDVSSLPSFGENNPNSGIGNENSANENSSNENSSNENTANENGVNENTSNENEANENSANENESNENEVNENSSNENESNENSGNENSGNENGSVENESNGNSSNQNESHENGGNENGGGENEGNGNSSND